MTHDTISDAEASTDPDTSRPVRDARRREETATLFEAAHAATSEEERRRLLDEIVVVNMGLARSLASRFRNRGVPLDDLEQVAMMSLVRIVPKFEPAPGRDFLSYAVPSIRGDLKRYFRDQGWAVRPPRRVQETQLQIRAHLSRGSGAETASQIAAELGLDIGEVEEALAAEGCFSVLSLDAPVGATETGMTLGDALDPGDDDTQRAAEARVILTPMIRRLSERDRRILALRFGADCTQQEIADELGVTQMQVSRLLARILGQLRREAGDRNPSG